MRYNGTMDHTAEGSAAIPMPAPAGTPRAQENIRAPHGTDFWPSFLMTFSLTSIAIGVTWDISWHQSIGRDTFWTPAHMAIYLGGALAGFTAGWLAIRDTFLAREANRDFSVNVFGARAPLGAWVAIWGAIAMLPAGPFDNWWHNAYGLDVRIISPPHVVLGLGMLGISVGALLLVLSRQNRFPDASGKGSGMFIYTGGVFILLGSVFLLEYIYPNTQHGSYFYKVCALMFPARLIAVGRSARISWATTLTAAVFMGSLCAIDWVLNLFPAHPKLAPIFNPITHMVDLPFPLLLIVPAMGIDLVLHLTRNQQNWWRQILIALVLGTVFLAIFIPVQWSFSKFLISPRAENWFFMGDRIWGYGNSRGDRWHEFWDGTSKLSITDLLTSSAMLYSWLFACASSWVGLFFGDWMRKVRR
jgi:hypothetical protein